MQIAIDDSVDRLAAHAAPRRRSNSGARPLRRAIQRYIEDELSEFLIRHKDSMPEWIDFTMNANEVLLMPRSTEALTP